MTMEFYDRNRLTRFYQDAYSAYGENDARSLHWTDAENQRVRFMVLSQIADLRGKSVLDVGCGLGDLYRFFLREGHYVEYRGIDVVPEFVTAARRKYPDAIFDVADVMDINERYDFVLASGALSFKVANHKEHYFGMIRKMFEIANDGVAFNMLDHATHVDNDEYAAWDQVEVANFCKTITPNVQVVTDYLPQDFTVYMYA